MIYVSSSCVKHSKISDSVKQLAEEGFKYIELSGGTKYYSDFERDLLKLQDQYGINYLAHNYFPPPEEPFVINLASLDREILELSMSNIRKAMQLTHRLGANKFSFHAGFLINIPLNQIGKSIQENVLFDRQKSLEIFSSKVSELKQEFPSIELFIENNVLSSTNYRNFSNINPFFLCDYAGYKELNQHVDFNLLLDVAHLKVTSKTLEHDFNLELDNLLSKANYIHISDNDGSADSNNTFSESSTLYKELRTHTFKNKTITLEVYDGMEALHESHQTTQKLMS
jgi:sugar phosphate isomerase/epimerase